LFNFNLQYLRQAQFARTDIRKQSFAVRAVEKWKRLPDWVWVKEKPSDSFNRHRKKAMAYGSSWKVDK
jgi:hypothetical protein